MRRFAYALVLGLILVCSTVTYADGRNSAAVSGGIAWPENTDATWYVTGAFRWHLDDNWAIEPDIGYWNQDEAEELCLARGCKVYGLSNLHAGASVLYMGSAGDIGLFTGGGLAAHWRKRETTRDVVPPENSPDLEETQLGLQILFGVDIPLATSLDLTAAVRNDFIFRDEDRGVDLDTQSVFKAYAGIRFYFD